MSATVKPTPRGWPAKGLRRTILATAALGALSAPLHAQGLEQLYDRASQIKAEEAAAPSEPLVFDADGAPVEAPAQTLSLIHI